MSIFKNTISPNLSAQLEARQNANEKRDFASIQYLNSRTAWIRMTSAVEVNGDGGALAKANVLLGGALYNNNPKIGVGTGASNAYSTVTSNNVSHRLGIRPLPGITGMEIKNAGAYGSLRKVTVNFNCWDIKQLEELELLYMRPHFTVLVEWGWIPYLNNNGTISNIVDFTDNVLEGVGTKEEIWATLFKKANTDGNYDASYGKIAQYNWSTRPDGGYDCSTTILTLGEAVESIKINYTLPNTNLSEVGLFGVQTKHADLFEKNGTLNRAYSRSKLAGMLAETWQLAIEDPKLDAANKAAEVKVGEISCNLFRLDFNVSSGNTSGGDSDNTSYAFTDKKQIYIALKDFVALLNKYILLYDSAGKTPFAELSVYEGNHNGSESNLLLCLGDKFQLSVDPTVCLIKNDNWKDSEASLNIKLESTSIKDIMSGLTLNFLDTTTNFGTIGNIYVNLGYLYNLSVDDEIASQDKKEKKDINLYDYIKNAMLGINASIGSVATFDLFVDPIDSKTRIIDINYVDANARKEVFENTFVIEVHNLHSTVRSYSLESNMSPEQSSMIAIGAQTEGGAIGSSTNTMIDFNKGIEDKIIPKKSSPPFPPPAADNQEKLNNLATNLKLIAEYTSNLDPSWLASAANTAIDIGKAFTGFVGVLVSYLSPGEGGPLFKEESFDKDQASKYANALKDLIIFYKSLTKDNNKNRAIIPTNLSLEMDGIGGLVVGSLFKINDDILPIGYKNRKTAFTITNIEHSIKDNDWITTIVGKPVLLDEPEGIEGKGTPRTISSYTPPPPPTFNIPNNNSAGGNPPSSDVGGTPFSVAKGGDPSAMKLAGNAIFDRHGGCASRCAQGTYAIARGYILALQGKQPDGRFGTDGGGDCWNALDREKPCSCVGKAGGIGAGNAGDSGYRKNLENLGYKMTSLGTLSKQQLIDAISKIDTIGTIINYRSITPTPDKPYANQYGHTQIYTGGVLNSSEGSNWASSFGHNYHTGFVYNSADSNSWEAYLFELPVSVNPNKVSNNQNLTNQPQNNPQRIAAKGKNSDPDKVDKNFASSNNFHLIPDGGYNNYRSQQMTIDGLKYAIKTYGIQNVIRMNHNKGDTQTGVTIDQEKALCVELGCSFNYIYAQEGYKQNKGYVTSINKITAILAQGNTLIHCNHGADRTGGHVGAWLVKSGAMTNLNELWKYTTKYNIWLDYITKNNGHEFWNKGGYYKYADCFYPVSQLEKAYKIPEPYVYEIFPDRKKNKK